MKDLSLTPAERSKLESSGFRLELDVDGRLGLIDLEKPEQKPVIVDFVSAGITYRREHGLGKNQPLAKALGLKSLKSGEAPFVFDATAGLGVDSFMMACLGCRVRAFERSPSIYALLQNGYQRLELEARRLSEEASDPSLSEIAWRLSFEKGEAFSVLAKLPDEERPDVIYLDPMYPEEGRSKSALPKKGMQVFRRLIGEDNDSERVWEKAILRARERVVVKRPIHAEPVGGRPTHSFMSKTVRYDMYICR